MTKLNIVERATFTDKALETLSMKPPQVVTEHKVLLKRQLKQYQHLMDQ